MKDTAVWAEACMAELFLNCDSWWGGGRSQPAVTGVAEGKEVEAGICNMSQR